MADPLGEGTPRAGDAEHRISLCGQFVVRIDDRDVAPDLPVTSAMMDGRGYPSPDQFRDGGPGRDYLHFGHPSRQCLGEKIARRQMVAIGAELLRHPNVRRASPMELDGPYPKRLIVAFDPFPA